MTSHPGKKQRACGPALTFLLLGVTVVRGECPPTVKMLLDAAERCLEPLSEPTNQTLVGSLSVESWKNSCSLYNTSLKCVEDLVLGCDESESHGERYFGDSILASLHSGLGQLCENENTFQRYLKHSECYAEQGTASAMCMNSYSQDVDAEIEHDQEDSTQEMCRIFHNLIHCINMVIETYCGRDAADLFDDIVKAQVPGQISIFCNSGDFDYSGADSEEHNAGVALRPTGALATVSALSTLLLLLLQWYAPARSL